jgi:hypothetical protein
LDNEHPYLKPVIKLTGETSIWYVNNEESGDDINDDDNDDGGGDGVDEQN